LDRSPEQEKQQQNVLFSVHSCKRKEKQKQQHFGSKYRLQRIDKEGEGWGGVAPRVPDLLWSFRGRKGWGQQR